MNWFRKILAQQQYLWTNDPQLPYANDVWEPSGILEQDIEDCENEAQLLRVLQSYGFGPRDFDEEVLRKRILDFKELTISDQSIAKKYDISDTRDWKLTQRRKLLASDNEWDKAFTTSLYRPFDVRHYYHHNDTVELPRNEVMKHLLKQDNQALCIGRQFGVIGTDFYDIVAVTDRIVDTNFYRRGGVNIFPLYLFNFPEDKKPKTALFEADDKFNGKDRIENFAPEFRAFIDQKYGHHYEPKEILGYIYAVLHSPAYRRKYAEFLKIDFPRIPFVADRQTFAALAQLGWALVQAHLLKEIPATPQVEVTKGSDLVAKPLYHALEQRLYINPQQYFAPVPEDVWNFHIGGYQVLDKYLKSRKDRKLSLDELENVMNVIKVLRFTLDQMQKIDSTWQP